MRAPVCIALVALALLACGRAAKRAEAEMLSQMPFTLGTRYGRSQPRLLSARNDRFFMAGRYGKRSPPGGAPALVCRIASPAAALYRCAPAAFASGTYAPLDGRSPEGEREEED